MTIKIIACAKPNYWYADHIGLMFAGCIAEKMNGQLTGSMIIPELKKWVFEGDYEIVNN